MAGEKVLVVDDRDDSIQFLTEYILEPNGYEYIIAKDGETGLRKALTEDPDLIIMDLKMPKMTGLEVLAALRERQSTIPVILMTFHGSEETAVQAFRLGARDYVIKPYDTQEMLESIERALTEVRLRAERDRLTQNIMRVNRQLERRVKELSILYSIGKSVTTLLDQEKVLNRIVEAAVYVTGAEEGTLMLVDKDSGELYMRAARGLGEKYARGFRLRVEDSIAGQVVRTGQPFLESGDAQRLKVKTGYLVKSLMYVPLKAGQEVIGVLSVDNKVSNTPFTESDVYLLSALADYASIAIVNARLYTEVKSFSEELEQKVVERTKELQEAQEQLIQSEKLASIGQLAAGVAHELNNPISVMLGFSQAILRKLPEDDPLRKPLATIEREGLRCKGIIQNLLDFARRSKPSLQPTNVNEVLEAACALIEHQISLDNVVVTKGYDPHLPQVLADANQLQQVFVNIIINARDAMPRGGTLRLITRSLGDEVHIIFSDTGIGIPPENIKRIFDPFFTTKEVGQGTGLGLSVSYGIVEQHGGTIEVKSEVGVGTTFIVKLPVMQGKAVEEQEVFLVQ
ncbi:MAG: response regulator [Anaerolineae bacterium]|nr:response regulator [Anaerolineae bacterium]